MQPGRGVGADHSEGAAPAPLPGREDATGPSPQRGEGRFAPAAIAAAALAQRLGWTPDTFWSATPADLRHALGSSTIDEALGGDTLACLMKEFPDG